MRHAEEHCSLTAVSPRCANRSEFFKRSRHAESVPKRSKEIQSFQDQLGRTPELAECAPHATQCYEGSRQIGLVSALPGERRCLTKQHNSLPGIALTIRQQAAEI